MRLNFFIAGYDNPKDTYNKELRGFYMGLKDKLSPLGNTVLPFIDVYKEDNPRTIWKRRKDQIYNTDVLVAYVGKQCMSTGMLLSHAQRFRGRIILVVEESKFRQIQPEVYGNPANVCTIKMDNFDDGVLKTYSKIKAMYNEIVREKQEKMEKAG